jgi:hypothetical protein
MMEPFPTNYRQDVLTSIRNITACKHAGRVLLKVPTATGQDFNAAILGHLHNQRNHSGLGKIARLDRMAWLL